MKKNRLNIIILISGLLFLLAFKKVAYEPNYSTAEVNKMDGLYIFTDSKPVMPYDSLGVVDIGFITGTQYESIRNNLISRAIKKYRHADGIILTLNKKGVDHCIAIQFKKR